MTRLTRREFLNLVSLGAGAAALAACGAPQEQGAAPTLPPTRSSASQAAPPAAPTSPPSTAPAASSAASPLPAASEPAAPAPGQPDLVVARGGEPADLVKSALQALGGIERFVPKGSRVLIKPNICVAYHTYEYAATTNPWVVAALVQHCLQAGASRVQVMDFPFGGSARDAYAKSGIAEQVEAAGGEMVLMSSFKYTPTQIPGAVDLKQAEVYDEALKADVLIDVPIAKHHGSARLSLGMKNLMGLVLDRGRLHWNLGQCIADLASLLRPTLTVVDAVRILTAHGPSGGSLDDVKKLDTLIASPDVVAADAYASTLFGLQPLDLDYIQAAAGLGLGNSDLKALRIQEVAVGG